MQMFGIHSYPFQIWYNSLYARMNLCPFFLLWKFFCVSLKWHLSGKHCFTLQECRNEKVHLIRQKSVIRLQGTDSCCVWLDSYGRTSFIFWLSFLLIAGEHCEIERRTQKYSVCPPGVCKGTHTRCTPLIRGGFRCELCADGDLGGDTCRDCAALDHHTPFCELTTRSFPRGSFLMYPSLRRRHRFNIRIKWVDRQMDVSSIFILFI